MQILSPSEFNPSLNESLMDRVPSFVLDDRFANQFESDITSKYQYKQLMEKEFSNAIPLVQVASKVGISENKFKAFIESTISDYTEWVAIDTSKAQYLRKMAIEIDKSPDLLGCNEIYFPEGYAIIPVDETYMVLSFSNNSLWVACHKDQAESF